MSSAMSHRTFTAGTVATLLGGSAVLSFPDGRAVAQGTDLSSLGLPTIDSAVNADAFEGLPADLPEPEADINVTFIDYGIEIEIEGSLTAGDHVLRIENLGAQPHFPVVQICPDEITLEDTTLMLDIFEAMEKGEEPPGRCRSTPRRTSRSGWILPPGRSAR